MTFLLTYLHKNLIKRNIKFVTVGIIVLCIVYFICGQRKVLFPLVAVVTRDVLTHEIKNS